MPRDDAGGGVLVRGVWRGPRTRGGVFLKAGLVLRMQVTKVKGAFSPCLVSPQYPKKCYSTCYIKCLHGALNVDEKN